MSASFHVRAAATSANLGFGFDTCGLALDDLADTMSLTITPSSQPQWTTIHTGHPGSLDLRRLQQHEGPTRLVRAAQSLLERVWPDAPAQHWAFHHTVRIPVAAGLGSSAAAAWAGAQLMAAWLRHEGLRPSMRQVREAAGKAEGGHWDNLAPLFTGGLAVVTEVPDGVQFVRVTEAPTAGAWRLVLVTPPGRTSTEVSRKALPGQIPLRVATRQMSALAQGLLAWQRGDLEALGWATAIDGLATPVRWSPLGVWAAAIKDLADHHGVPALWISGSGPTLALLVADAADAQRVAAQIADHHPSLEVRISRLQSTPDRVTPVLA